MGYVIKRFSDFGDKWYFLIFVVVGCLIIIVGRFYEINVLKLYPCVLLVMFFYAYQCWKSEYFRIRSDKAGDNIYYLGFIFTLVSLLVSLYQSGNGASNTEQIISNFGIALLTTVVGVTGRVLFSQLRDTPQEIETESLNTISDVARELKSQLDDIVTDFNIFKTSLKQSTNELQIEWLSSCRMQLEQMNSFHNEFLTGLKKKQEEVVFELVEFKDATKSLTESINNIEISPDIFRNQLNEVLGDFREFLKKIQESFSKRISKVENFSDSISNLIKDEEALAEVVRKISEFNHQQIEMSKSSVIELINYVDSFKEYIDQQAKKVEEASSIAENGLLHYNSLFSKMASSVEGDNTKLLSQYNDLKTNIEDVNGTLNEAINKQNKLLENLLSINVTKFSSVIKDKISELESASSSVKNMIENEEKLTVLLQKTLTTADNSINGMNLVSKRISQGLQIITNEIRTSSSQHNEYLKQLIEKFDVLTPKRSNNVAPLNEQKREDGMAHDSSKPSTQPRRWFGIKN